MTSNLSFSLVSNDYVTPKTVLCGAGCMAALYTAKSLYDAYQLPPGPWCPPLLGRLPWLDPDHMDESQEKMRQRYGPIFSYRAGQRLMVVVSSHELMREMFKEDDFSGRLVPPQMNVPSRGSGIFVSEGPTWSNQRRICLRVLRDFGFAKAQSVEAIHEEVSMILRSIETKSTDINALHLFMWLTNSVIATVLFGKRYANQDKRYDQFVKDNSTIFNDSLSASLTLLFPSFQGIVGWFMKSSRTIEASLSIRKFITEEIVLRESELTDPDAEPLCLADAYIQERRRAEANGDFESFKQQNLMRVCSDLIIAGTDSTARSLEWLMAVMAVYPNVQSQVQHEIDQVVGSERRPQLSDKESLHYTQSVIDETFRFGSLAFSGAPHRAVRHGATFRGFKIPSDAVIVPFIYGAHRDPAVWQRPDDFLPERFLDRDGKYVSSKFLLPFGVGKRACPGESLARLEIFHAFTAVMQRYSVKLSESCRDKAAEILRGKTATLRDPSGLLIDFAAR